MNTKLRTLGIAALIAIGSIALPGVAGTVASLTVFTPNTPARAAEVNGNFTAVKIAVDDNQAQITALTSRIAALEAQLTNITALNAYLSLQTVDGRPTVRVSAANLQVVNGAGSTAQVNGLGNLIVGYAEARAATDAPTCSVAASDTISLQSICTANGGTWAVNHRGGSHNLVVGTQNNYSSYGGVVAGVSNALVGAYASVTGGLNNVAAGEQSSVSGGLLNSAWGLNNSILGGSGNRTTNKATSVAGGFDNLSTAQYAVVLGGSSNLADGDASAIVGGSINESPGAWSVVGGGLNNVSTGQGSSVSGGRLRQSGTTGGWAGGTFSSNQ